MTTFTQETQTTFTSTLNKAISTFTIAEDKIKSLKVEQSNTVNNLFCDIENMILKEVALLKEKHSELEEVSIYKISTDLINEALIALDDKQTKEENILLLLKFISENRLKVSLGLNANGAEKIVPLGTFKTLFKFENILDAKIIKEIRKLHIVGDYKNNKIYNAKLKTYADLLKSNEEARVNQLLLQVIGQSKIDKINEDNITDILAGINNLKKGFKA